MRSKAKSMVWCLLILAFSLPTHHAQASVCLVQQSKDQVTPCKRAFDEAERLLKIGSAESLKAAIPKYEEAIQCFRAVGNRPLEARSLNNMGYAYDSIGEKRKGLDLYQQALVIDKELGNLKESGTILHNIGGLYSDLGEKKKALDYYSEAMSLWRATNNKRGEANTLNSIGLIYDALSEDEKALQFFNQSLELSRAVGDLSLEAHLLNNIGGLYFKHSDLRKALDFYLQSLPIARPLGLRRLEATNLVNIAAVYDGLGEIQKALEYLQAALPILKATGNRSVEALTLGNIGGVYHGLGQREKALDFYQQALTILRAVGNRDVEAITLNNIGLLYRDLNENQKALEYFSQALLILRAVGNRRVEAITLRNIGVVYFAQGELQKALELYNESLSISQAVGNRSGEARAFNNIGMAYDTLGERQKALESYDSALAIARNIEDHEGEGIVLINIGAVYHALGEKLKAVQYYTRALPILRALGDRNGEATALANLMWLWKDSKPNLAVFFGKQAVNLYQQLRVDISGLEREIQRTYLHSIEANYRNLADLLIANGRLPEAQQVLSLLKEEEYFEFVRRDSSETSSLNGHTTLTEAEAAVEKQYVEIADGLTALGAERAALIAKSARTPAEETRLAQLDNDIAIGNEAFQKFLDQMSQQLGSEKQLSRVAQITESEGLMETLRALGPGTAILYTLVGDDKFRIILVTADVRKAYEFPIAAAELNHKILAFREAVQNPRIDPRPLGQELFKIIVGSELTRDLTQAKITTLMWSLDGVLRYLPVAALYDGQHYLIERYRTAVFTPASQSRLKDEVTAHWKVLGLGVSKSQPGFDSLPGVSEELAGIVHDEANPKQEKGILAGKVLLDEAFTAASMQTALRQHYPLVHIASHFQFRPGNETNSFLLLGDGTHFTLAEIKRLGQVFDGVDLLTLSACNTATGGAGADGKEVEGFGVLAQLKGAKAVMATLWPVADESTQLMMREFYRLREANPQWSKAEALRQAQLELLAGQASGASKRAVRRAEIAVGAGTDGHQSTYAPDPNAPFAHPYFWAPFILIGNWK